MAFVKYTDTARRFEVGEWAVTTRKVTSSIGYFEKGTRVRVIGRSSLHGYDLEDEDGNRIYDTGFDSIA